MMTQTFLLVMVGAAVKSSDVVKAGGKKTLAAMDAPTRAWGRLPFASKAVLTSWLNSLPSISSCKAGSLDGGWCSRESVQVPQEFMIQPLLPSQITKNLVTKSSVLSVSQLVLEGKKKNLASASLRNGSAVKLGNLMS